MPSNRHLRQITPQELNHWISEDRAFVLINTLPGDVFEKQHIPQSVNACVYEVTFPEQVSALVEDKRQAVVLYGSSERSRDAAAAADKLVRLGYANVYVLVGGLLAWQLAGYGVAGTAGQAQLDPETQISLTDGLYRVNLEESRIEWTGRNPHGKHYGTIQLTSGRLTVHNGEIGGAFVVDMQSIKNADLAGDELEPVLIAHLESDDFFFVKLFPEAEFNIQKGVAISPRERSSPNYRFEGNLKLRGVQNDLHFDATAAQAADGTLSVEAHFDIDRTRWNVLYGSSRFFEHLGMHLVFDRISFQVRIVALKEVAS